MAPAPRLHPGFGHGLRPDGFDPNGCSLIYFYGTSTRQDVINGKLAHEQPAARLRDTQFKDLATTSYPGYQPTSASSGETGDDLGSGLRAVRTTRASSRTATRPTSTTATRSALPSNGALKSYTAGTTGGASTPVRRRSSSTLRHDDGRQPHDPDRLPFAGLPGYRLDHPATGSIPSNGVIYVDSTTSSSCNGSSNANKNSSVPEER